MQPPQLGGSLPMSTARPLLASHQASMIRHANAKASSQRDYLPPFFGLPTSSARRDEVGLQACSPSTPAAESSCECLRTTSKMSRQLSASSPASTRASGGARVLVRGEEVEEEIMTAVSCVFIRIGTAQRNYVCAPGGSHLKDTWPACNLLEVVPCSHARLVCQVVVPASPVFRQKRYNIESSFKCVSLYLQLTRTQ